jgi:hypothetical protein
MTQHYFGESAITAFIVYTNYGNLEIAQSGTQPDLVPVLS